MRLNSLTIGMVGSGGDGVVTAGDMLLSTAAKEGLYALSSKSFGPQIRGGESSMRVRLSHQPVYNTGSGLDYLIVLNWHDYGRFSGELNIAKHGVILYEADPKIGGAEIPLEVQQSGATLVPLAFHQLAEAAAPGKTKNIFTLGILSVLSGLNPQSLEQTLTQKFRKKGEDIVHNNLAAFAAGVKLAHTYRQPSWPTFSYQPSTAKMLLDGNQAIAAAALAAGVQVFAGYPITPSTEVMQYLVNELPKFKGTVIQAEDEISAMAIVCGASFAGAKAMTTTSGPGMSLKTELLGLASMAELPAVIVNVQRGGPSTGLPTKGEQADLYQALFSAHGDVLRPVVAPYDALSAIRVTFEAFNIAETYQTPVILLSDGFIAQSKQSGDFPDLYDTKLFPVTYRQTPSPAALAAGYKRFLLQPPTNPQENTWVTPMSIPGMEHGTYLASGIEHNAEGKPLSDAKLHHLMNQKRIEKLAPLSEREDLTLIFGPKTAKEAVITFGSSVGPTIEALELLKTAAKRELKLLVPLLLAPLPLKALTKFLEGVERLYIIELNYQAQLAHYLRMHLNLPPEVIHINRSGGAIFQPAEIFQRLQTTNPEDQR